MRARLRNMKQRSAAADVFEADLEAGIGALFRRHPSLCGFTVQDVSELFLSELSVYPSHGLEARDFLQRDILRTLTQLIDECPETRKVLRERTFARTVH
jgi:hypothetical protein